VNWGILSSALLGNSLFGLDSGRISSGKSSIIKHLSISYDCNIISFGNYVRHITLTRGLPFTRTSYQLIGQKLFSEQSPDEFLQNVIRFHAPSSEIHLYDGIRHTSIIDALRRLYRESLVIYLAVDDYQRYLRFTSRAAQGDPLLSFEEFLKLDKQPIERGIAAIAAIADVSLNASIPLHEFTTTIDEIPAIREFISSNA
jgi:dephospho-CoA kinase